MPGTGAKGASEDRAWPLSLELIGQGPTPTECVEGGLVDLVWLVHLVWLVDLV